MHYSSNWFPPFLDFFFFSLIVSFYLGSSTYCWQGTSNSEKSSLLYPSSIIKPINLFLASPYVITFPSSIHFLSSFEIFGINGTCIYLREWMSFKYTIRVWGASICFSHINCLFPTFFYAFTDPHSTWIPQRFKKVLNLSCSGSYSIKLLKKSVRIVSASFLYPNLIRNH